MRPLIKLKSALSLGIGCVVEDCHEANTWDCFSSAFLVGGYLVDGFAWAGRVTWALAAYNRISWVSFRS